MSSAASVVGGPFGASVSAGRAIGGDVELLEEAGHGTVTISLTASNAAETQRSGNYIHQRKTSRRNKVTDV